MSLTIVFGDIGSGKTLLMTALALGDNRKVLSNFKINSPRFEPLNINHLVDMDEPTLVLMDEGYTLLESRTSSKGVNRYLSAILFQSRKREMDIVLSCQLLSTIDVRFRDLCHFVIYADRTGKDFTYKLFKISNKPSKPRSFSIPYETAVKEIFPFYDTREIVGFYGDSMDDLVVNKKEVSPLVDEHANKLLRISRDGWTKGAIADYCDENGLGKVYVDLIYNRVKRKSLA